MFKLVVLQILSLCYKVVW